MLKSKDAYANENAFIRAHFIHKGICTDFPIDPITGSFIRMVTPSTDAPKSVHTIYSRPQFFFGTVSGCSRMHEISDYVKFLKTLEMIQAALEAKSAEERDAISVEIKSDLGLRLNAYGDIEYKMINGLATTFVMGRASNARPDSLLNQQRVLSRLKSMQEAIAAIGLGKQSSTEIISVNDNFMTMVPRSDHGMRHPIIIRGRASNEVVEGGTTYFTMVSRDQRFVFQQGKDIKAIDTVNGFMNLAGELAEMVLNDGIDRVAPLTRFCSNMDYVNAKLVPYDSGDRVLITLNSDRFPANTKFQYAYDMVEHVKLHCCLQQFVEVVTA